MLLELYQDLKTLASTKFHNIRKSNKLTKASMIPKSFFNRQAEGKDVVTLNSFEIDWDTLITKYTAAKQEFADINTEKLDKLNLAILKKFASLMQREVVMNPEVFPKNFEKLSYHFIVKGLLEKIRDETGMDLALFARQIAMNLAEAKDLSEQDRQYIMKIQPVGLYIKDPNVFFLNPKKLEFRSLPSIFQIIFGDITTVLHHEYIHQQQKKLTNEPKRSRREPPSNPVLAIMKEVLGNLLLDQRKLQAFFQLGATGLAKGDLAMTLVAAIYSMVLTINTFGKKTEIFDAIITNESDAYIGSLEFGNGRYGASLSNFQTLLKEQYGVPETEIKRIVDMYLALKRLHALKIPSKNISELMLETKWDKKRKSYSSLWKIIKKEQKRLGVSDAKLEELVEAGDIEKKIKLLKIANLSYQALQKAVEINPTKEEIEEIMSLPESPWEKIQNYVSPVPLNQTSE